MPPSTRVARRARVGKRDPAGDLEAGVARRRVLEGALEPAERDRFGVDRPRGEERGGQEHGDERGADDETVGRGPFQDQTPGREKESAHRDFDARGRFPVSCGC